MDNNSNNTGQDGGHKKSIFDDLTREELIYKCKGFLALAHKAKLSKSELQDEVKSFKIQLDKSEAEKKASQDNVRTLQELVDSLTEQKLNYITEIDSAQSKIKMLNVRFVSYEQDIMKYKADLIVKDKHIADVTLKLSDIDTEIVSLKRQNNRLLEENEQLINQLTELESRTAEFNNIGLRQREQLQMLEEKVQKDDTYKIKAEELKNQIQDLEKKLQAAEASSGKDQQVIDYETKIKEVSHLYETEKVKNEKANIKLRSYKDKILKCAACINQLKNSRFILSKTVKEYSENIPKWQNDIIIASKVLDEKLNDLNNENQLLKEKLEQFEQQLKKAHEDQVDPEMYNSKITELTSENKALKNEMSHIHTMLHERSTENIAILNELTELKSEQQIHESKISVQINENELLKEQLNEITGKLNGFSMENKELNALVNDLKIKNKNLNESLKSKIQNDDIVQNLNLQIKALESEKAILVKEKLNARDNVVELEHHNKILTDKLNQMKSEIETVKTQMKTLSQEKSVLEKSYKTENASEINNINCRFMALQEQYDLLKKEHDNVQDLNGLLKEEVETLKLSLEQPKDENLSDLNVSLQTDIVKLETKLSAYKQENASLLIEVKESRAKVKEFDALIAECEEAKSKLTGYKTENTELLNEMKEINQVLKERGESISKLQKAVAEMERLIETLETDRDSVKSENDDLYKKIGSLENDLRNAKQKTHQNGEESEQIIAERDNAVKSLSEKDKLIASLKDEIEKLKQHQTSSAELPNEDMSTSTISKAEEHSRMKDLDETFEEKYTKLRIFALKLKKKLNETTTQLQNAEQDKAKLEKLLSVSDVTENKIPSLSTGEELGKAQDNKCKVSELEMRVQSLTDAAEASEKIAAELEQVKAKLINKSQDLSAEIDAHKVTKDNLEKARRDVKKKSVLSLEMEDYERSMKELTLKMEESKKKMVQMESTIDTQEGTITAMKTQIKLLEEQIKTEESLNRTVKEELQHSVDEGKEKDNVIQVKNGIISKLEQDLEDEKRKNEEADLEMTSVLSEKEKVIMSLGEEKAELNNKLKRIEFKCGELNEKLRISNIELADLKTEYTSYKVRAQAVLRQNQTVDHSQEEQLKEEAAALKAQLETLTAKFVAAQEQLSEQGAEVEASRRRAGEAGGDAARAQQRTARLQADLTRLGQQLDSERTQHKLQVSTLTQCYKTQINELETKYQREAEALRKQLSAAHDDVMSVRVAGTADGGSRTHTHTHNQYMLPVIHKEDSDGEMDINVSLIPREEGEGSESAPSPPPSKAYLGGGAGGRRSPVSLERLLEEGVPEDEALDTASLALTPEQEISDLSRKLQAQQQRVKHVTVLLSESERECARMSQLAELLKSELRRVRGATHHAHNTEYMKNVTLKFLTLPPGDERSRLVPVLQKILTLTNDEIHKIQAIAKGLDPNPSKGWGSYLPWPGGNK